MSSEQPDADERRIAQRMAVDNQSPLAQRTHLVVPGQSRAHKCRITDTSATGYLIVLLSPNPEAGRQFAPGQEVLMEHIDGWSRAVSIRWIKGNQLGLKILNPVTRMILTDDCGAPQPYDCKLLGTHSDLYRVTMSGQPVMFGVFTLELPNGERLPVRVRWTVEGEICLQRVQHRRRL